MNKDLKIHIKASDGRQVDVDLPTITAIENDPNNGYKISSNPLITNLWFFFSQYQDFSGITFNVNGLKGLIFEPKWVTRYYNKGFYKDETLHEQLQVIECPLYAKFKNDTKQHLFTFVFTPTTYYWESDITSIGSVIPTNRYFVWNATTKEVNCINFQVDMEVTDSYSLKYTNKRVVLNNTILPNRVTKNPTPLHYNVQDGTIYSDLHHYLFTNYSMLEQGDDDNAEVDDSYPYPPESSDEEGGNGDNDDSSDNILVEDVDGIYHGFTSLYKVTPTNLTVLKNFLYTDDFIQHWKKLFTDPFNAIISLNSLPINVSGNNQNIVIAGIDTGVSGLLINNSITLIDCGTLTLTEYYGSFIDYQSKLSLYLPYVGIVDLSAQNFIGNSINVKYRVDVLSGAFTCFVSNTDNIVATYSGTMAYSMPITSLNYSAIFQSLITLGVGACMGAPIMPSIGAFQYSSQNKGAYGGNSGTLGNRKPYLILENKVPSIPSNYNSMVGIESNVTRQLASLKGYTEVETVNIKCDGLLDEEIKELEEIMKSGFYI